MHAGRFVKAIDGIVFHDVDSDGIRNNSEHLKNVGIRLFLVADRKEQGDNDTEIKISEEKLIIKTTTNDKGEFRFIVKEGTYCINLDISTLPAGKGITETSRLVPPGVASHIEFVVKDVESVDVGKTNRKVPVDIRLQDLCSTERIKLVSKLGLISEQTKMQYLAHAMFQPDKLPEEYRSSIPLKSGTGILEELNRYLGSRSIEPEISQVLRQAVSSSVPELDKTYRSASGYFDIHYTLSGDNAVDLSRRDYRAAVPYYIAQVGEAFDKVRAITCFTRGFREPVLSEGKNVYDIYVYDLKDKYGVTYSSKISSAQNNRTNIASSYICIDNNYSKEKGFDKTRLECMKVTAAHEFFHAVQFAYNVEADTWWKEASATWNEDEIYTEINDYVRYIESYFKAPYQSLDETSYSGVVYVKFLAENYGGYDSIRKIWEVQSSGYNNSIQAIDRFLRTNYDGKDIGQVYNQFSTYNTNPAQYYREGAAWNLSAAAQNTYAKYPVAISFGQLDHLSSNYQLFRPTEPQTGKSLKITIDGMDGVRWGFKLQKRNSGNKLFSTTEITSRGTYSRAEIDLQGFGTVYDEIWLIPANLETGQNSMPYSYSAEMK